MTSTMTYAIEVRADVEAIGGWLELAMRNVAWRIRPSIVTAVLADMQYGTDEQGGEQLLGGSISMFFWEVSGIRRIDLFHFVPFKSDKHEESFDAAALLLMADELMNCITDEIDLAANASPRRRKTKSQEKKAVP